jgi:hypothetical protein
MTAGCAALFQECELAFAAMGKKAFLFFKPESSLYQVIC